MANNTSFTPQEIEQFLQQFFDVVGARQYIGARYVPIFGRAGSETVEWDDLAPYEPLTVVMHDGISYVSRRYVPAGIDITDTDYWVETYRFNAQVEQYRQQVIAMQDDVDNRIPFPDPDFYPRYGELGQVLSTLADGTVKWQDPVVPSDAQAEEVISQWLEDHPEATTTVQDGAITTAKLANGAVTNDKVDNSVIARIQGTKTSADYSSANDLPNNRIIQLSNSDSNISDLPDGFVAGTVLTYSYNPTNNGTYINQIATSFSPGADMKMWYRRSRTSGSIWNAWVQIYPADTLDDASVTTAALASLAVTTAKLADASVTEAKVDTSILARVRGQQGYSAYSDANDIPNNRIVYISDPNNQIANLPPNFKAGYVVTLSYNPVNDGRYIMQMACEFTGAGAYNLWFRRSLTTSATWKDWVPLFIQGTANTRGYRALGAPLTWSGKRIALVGDSITAGVNSTGYVRYTIDIEGVSTQVDGNGPDYPDAGPGYVVGTLLRSITGRQWYTPIDGNGWAQRLKAYLEEKFSCTVTNLGLASCNIRNVSSALLNDLKANYDIVIFGMGANDRVSVTPISTFFSEVKSFVSELLQADTNVILWSENPASIANEAGKTYHMEDAAYAMAQAAIDTNTPFIDVYSELLNYASAKGVSIDTLIDGVHPNDTGYGVIYDIMTTKLGTARKRDGATW